MNIFFRLFVYAKSPLRTPFTKTSNKKTLQTKQKNMKTKYLNWTIALLLLIALSACKKENSLPLADNIISNPDFVNSPGISLVKGRLVFADSAVFKNHISSILANQKDQELINSFNTGIGFKSFVQIYTDGMNLNDPILFEQYIKKYPACFKKIDLEDGSIFYELPLGMVYANIANSDGIYQIGKRIIRATEDFMLILKDGDENKISKILLNPSEINDPSIEKFIFNSAVKSTAPPTGQYSYKTAYFNTKLRIVARLYCENIPGGRNYEVRTSSQQKMLGGWYLDRISKLGYTRHTGTYYQYYSEYQQDPIQGPYTIISDYYEDTNVSDIRHGVLMAWPPIEFNSSSCLFDHFGERSSGRVEINSNDLFPDNI